MNDGGKGSSPRPKSVSNEEYANRWDAIFQRDMRKIEDQQNEDEEFEAILKRNRENALQELVDISQSLGLYEFDDMLTRYNEETQEVKK
jgi:hypothetical protein